NGSPEALSYHGTKNKEQRTKSAAAMLLCSLFPVLSALDQEPRCEQRQLFDRAGAHMGVRQRVEELLAVLLGQQPLVEDSHDATVFLRADEPPKALLEAQD